MKLAEPKQSILMDGRLKDIMDDPRADGLVFRNEICDRSLDHLEFYECVFENIEFTESMKECMFVDAVMDHCDLSNVDLRNSLFRRVQFRNCRMTGTDLSGSRFQDVSFQEIQAGYINFNGSRFTRVHFENAVMDHAGMSMCEQKDLEIHSCRLEHAEFFQTRLNGVDLSDSEIGALTVTPESLQGLTVNEEQAAAFAALFGLIVKTKTY
ncbi:MAG: pentapeptide repeat-containing protein [Solobacterium sp.]|nr:pentapeptide repeat-containing protein [Solobacterium sp.]